MSETAVMLRERAAWEVQRADRMTELADQCRRAAVELIKKAEEVEQRRGAYRWLT